MKVLFFTILLTSTTWAKEPLRHSQVQQERFKEDLGQPNKLNHEKKIDRFPASILQERQEERPMDRPEPRKLDKNFRQVTPERW